MRVCPFIVPRARFAVKKRVESRIELPRAHFSSTHYRIPRAQKYLLGEQKRPPPVMEPLQGTAKELIDMGVEERYKRVVLGYLFHMPASLADWMIHGRLSRYELFFLALCR